MCMHSTGCFPVYCFDVLLCWIGPANCQPKWLRARSVEIWHEEKYLDCWPYHVGRWTVNETKWKTVHKPPKSFFWKANCGNWVFSLWILRSVGFSLVFLKPISDIFNGFLTSNYYHYYQATSLGLEQFQLLWHVTVAWSVCPSVTLVHPVKAAGPNKMPFGIDTRAVLSSIVLNSSPGPSTGEV